MHERHMGNVAVGEDHLLNGLVANQLPQLFFWINRNAVWIQGAAQFGRVAPALDSRNLSSRERDNLVIGIIAKAYIEIVEIPARGAKNENALPL